MFVLAVKDVDLTVKDAGSNPAHTSKIMKKYTKIYLDKFKYDTDSHIPCECCGDKAVDIHHILSRKRRADLYLDINNLMAVCRKCHQEYGDINYCIPMLFKIHKKMMHQEHIEFDEDWFKEIIEKYED